MKQKEAQAIKKLIAEKGASDAAGAAANDAERAQRKAKERSAKEAKNKELEKAHQLARKRLDQVAKYDAKVAKKSRLIMEKAREWKEKDNAEKARFADAKSRLIKKIWKEK